MLRWDIIKLKTKQRLSEKHIKRLLREKSWISNLMSIQKIIV